MKMGYRETDSVFEIKYQDENGSKKTVQYDAVSKAEAQKLFNAEKEPGEKLLSVKKIS
jgi:hypothetical protein